VYFTAILHVLSIYDKNAGKYWYCVLHISQFLYFLLFCFRVSNFLKFLLFCFVSCLQFPEIYCCCKLLLEVASFYFVNMSAAVTFNDIVLDDNNNYARSKKDDSPQTLTFSVTKSEWIPCPPPPPSSLSSSSTASVSSIWNQLRLENLNKHNLWLIFASIFLPIGYPSSVTSDYGMFQICDTIQALCSYLRGLLTTRATLIGIGVGKQSANATSAIVQFIFRDLSGLVGNVLFSWKYSFSFGIEVKQWRLFADVINDLALTLELLSPFFASKFVFVCILCIASVCKAMCGVSAGATRIAIAKHFALKDNETDLVAKEGIQETFVTILGMLLCTSRWS